ncbi:MAG: V-type ATP synthase subunit D [Candidatus Methylarchaceae archaeon HK02M1]|nr:V-type ATP synthase subunit D [Candidatus Methylarchaceae archaeon HK01M]MCP8311674.1 V-type ATP synthase subunit D [Candidatus Methylarchaceae archaeon HK02M1]
MSSAIRAAATKGVLLRLREQLAFIEKGKEILEMKREQLAGEINHLLAEVKIRGELEKGIMDSYEHLKKAHSMLGYQNLQSMALTVSQINVSGLTYSVMGVVVPELRIEKEIDISNVPSGIAYEAAEKLSKLLRKIIRLGESEAKIEKLVDEFMSTNRKVNALDQIVIPSISSSIRYIEGRLYEEMLEEFIRTKHIREVIRRRRA